MPYYTSGDYVYLNNNDTRKKNHHKVFILNQESYFCITSPLKLLAENVLLFPKIFVKEMLEPWIKHNIQVVYQLSKIYALKKNKKNQMYIGREDDICLELCQFY